MCKRKPTWKRSLWITFTKQGIEGLCESLCEYVIRKGFKTRSLHSTLYYSIWDLCSVHFQAYFSPFLSVNLFCHRALLYLSVSVSLYAGPGVRHVAHLLSPFNSSLPIRLFRPLLLCSRHSSLLGQVPFLLMRWKWAVGIAKRSGADLWQHFTTALHENTQTGPGETRLDAHRQWRRRSSQWHRKLRGWPHVIQLDSSSNTWWVRCYTTHNA